MTRSLHLLVVLAWLAVVGRLPAVVRDTTFQAVLEQAGEVRTLAMHTNGSILVGGQFHRIGPLTRNALALVDTAGNPIPEFDAHLLGDASIQSLLVQPDGRILVGGRLTLAGQPTRTTVIRLLPDGSPDDSFRLRLPEPLGNSLGLLNLTFDPAGRIYLAAYSTWEGGNLLVARLGSDGTPDPERLFIMTAVVRVPGDVQGPKVHVTSDGHLYLAGVFTYAQIPGNTSGFGISTEALVRMRSDGTWDPTFQPPLPEPWSSSGLEAGILDSTLLPDGRLVIGGAFRQLGRFTRRGLAILHPDGELDLDFRPGDLESAVVRSILPGPDGTLLASGQLRIANDPTPRMLVRFLADGRLDPRFTPVASPSHPFTTTLTLLAASPDRILVGGRAIGSEGPVGSALGVFDGNGLPGTTSQPTFRTAGWAHVIQPLADGSTFVAGAFAWINGESADRFARLQADGTLDPSFRMVPAITWVRCAAPGPDGGLFLGGDFAGTNSRVFRITAAGDLAPGFSAPALTRPAMDLLPWSNGRLLVAGTRLMTNPDEFFNRTNSLIALGPDGSVQSNAFPNLAWPAAGAMALAPAPDGGFYFARTGWISPDMVVRVGPDGLETGFWLNPPATNLPIHSGSLNGFAVDPQGRVILAGSLHPVAPSGLMRFNSNGEPDPRFVPTELRGTARKVLVDGVGGVLATGTFQFSETATNWVGCLRLLPDGGLDTEFPTLQSTVTGIAAPATPANAVYIAHIGYGGPNPPAGRIDRYLLDGSGLTWTWSAAQRQLVVRAPASPNPLRWETTTDLRTWVPVPGAGSGPEISWDTATDTAEQRFFRIVPASPP